MSNSTPVKYGYLALALLVIAIALFSSFYTVDSGQRAILLTNGRVTSVEKDGLHFKIPFFQSVVRVDVRTQKAEASAPAATYDIQMVKSKVAANYHLQADKVGEIYAKSGLDVEDRLIDPRIQESVKAIIAHYPAEQLLTKRDVVRGEILATLQTKLAPYYITVEDIQITDFQFSAVFDEAIERKQTAEQNALTEKNNLVRVKIMAEQAVATAQGQADSNLAIASADAKAIALRGQALHQYPEVLELSKVNKWDGRNSQTVLSSSSQPLVQIK